MTTPPKPTDDQEALYRAMHPATHSQRDEAREDHRKTSGAYWAARDREQELRESCPLCGHLWRQHDPEDGRCDSHTSDPDKFGACECGRDIQWMQERIAGLSRDALTGAGRAGTTDAGNRTHECDHGPATDDGAQEPDAPASSPSTATERKEDDGHRD